mmetsp:Transcript_44383/g.73973  ORF Transcript_44383/g.73973 Transcript_44383/m.73973 type:complete len:90 (-) Transcript_44383:101-370(-)
MAVQTRLTELCVGSYYVTPFLLLASSLTVAAGYRVTMYANADGTCASKTFTRNVADLAATNFNDRASSVLVQKGECLPPTNSDTPTPTH